MKSYFPDVNVWLALAKASGLTLVTFDKALGKLAGKECVLLA